MAGLIARDTNSIRPYATDETASNVRSPKNRRQPDKANRRSSPPGTRSIAGRRGRMGWLETECLEMHTW